MIGEQLEEIQGRVNVAHDRARKAAYDARQEQLKTESERGRG